VGKFLFSFLLPQKLIWKRNVVLAYNVLQLMAGGFLANKVCSRLTLGAVSGVGRILSVGSLFN
jgi:hypothetical protein